MTTIALVRHNELEPCPSYFSNHEIDRQILPLSDVSASRLRHYSRGALKGFAEIDFNNARWRFCGAISA
jgi:hypothetical protein